MRYQMYSDNIPVATFDYERGVIARFDPEKPKLLPMQIRSGSAETFTLWLQDRAIDLNTFQHRELMRQLLGSGDKLAVSIATNMFSITDAFTCFPDGEFITRDKLWNKDTQDAVSDFILVSSDTSLRLQAIVTPNASTDGSFPKTWRYEDGEWWLYKIQTTDASHSEYAISRVIIACGWDAAEYRYEKGTSPSRRIKTRNFVRVGEWFEPYDSLRFMFDDKSDDDETIYDNLKFLGTSFEKAYRRILLADGVFMNSDRHMRNFGVIRSTVTGEILRMAPNFDNNQAYKSNAGVSYSNAMLRGFEATFGLSVEDKADLQGLSGACESIPYLHDAYKAMKEHI